MVRYISSCNVYIRCIKPTVVNVTFTKWKWTEYFDWNTFRVDCFYKPRIDWSYMYDFVPRDRYTCRHFGGISVFSQDVTAVIALPYGVNNSSSNTSCQWLGHPWRQAVHYDGRNNAPEWCYLHCCWIYLATSMHTWELVPRALKSRLLLLYLTGYKGNVNIAHGIRANQENLS